MPLSAHWFSSHLSCATARWRPTDHPVGTIPADLGITLEVASRRAAPLWIWSWVPGAAVPSRTTRVARRSIFVGHWRLNSAEFFPASCLRLSAARRGGEHRRENQVCESLERPSTAVIDVMAPTVQAPPDSHVANRDCCNMRRAAWVKLATFTWRWC